jgi:hypothetical protein
MCRQLRRAHEALVDRVPHDENLVPGLHVEFRPGFRRDNQLAAFSKGRCAVEALIEPGTIQVCMNFHTFHTLPLNLRRWPWPLGPQTKKAPVESTGAFQELELLVDVDRDASLVLGSFELYSACNESE